MSTTLSSPDANPFAASRQSLATVHVESERAVAEVQAAMMLARRFPRNPVEAMDRILNACTRQSLAEGALYTYSRGGADISGPSIRLAEAMAQSWGNLQFGIRELEQRNGESTVEAFAWDIETNTRQVKVFQVPHIRYSKERGNTRLTDPRDIYELVANQGARRVRACILGIIPGDVTEAAVAQCETTLNTSAEVTPDSIAKILAFFEQHGVTREQIEQNIQRRMDAMQPAQMVKLRKIGASLKDGMSKPGDWFKQSAPEPFVPSDFPPPAATADADQIPGGIPAEASAAADSSSPAGRPAAEPAPGQEDARPPASAGKTPARRTAKPEAAPLVLDTENETARERLQRRIAQANLDPEKVAVWFANQLVPPVSDMLENEAEDVLKLFGAMQEECKAA